MRNLMRVLLSALLLPSVTLANADECYEAEGFCTIELSHGSNNATGEPLIIRGFYPTGDGPFPVMAFLRGTFVDPAYTDTDPILTTAAVSYGTAAVVMEYSDWNSLDAVADIAAGEVTLCDVTGAKASELFGPADDTGLSVLCAHEKIDCSLGVGVAGNSQGAEIATFASGMDSRVTAYLGLALATTYFWGGNGTVNECYLDTPLEKEFRRFLKGEMDKDYDIAAAFGRTDYKSEEEYRALNLASVKMASGYDCGESLDCIQSDGSGYALIPGGDHTSVWQVDSDNFAYTLNAFIWLANRLASPEPGCPCDARRRLRHRRKLLFGSLPDECCAYY